MVIAYFISKKRNYPRRTEAMTWGEILKATQTSIIALLMPVIIVGGMLGGIFTATEAAAVGSAYAILICLFVLKTVRLRDIPEMLFNTAKISSIILFLLGTTNILSWVLTINDVGQMVVKFFLSMSSSVYVFLFVVNIIFLVIGMFVDTFPAILITRPFCIRLQ
jgi:TRAP-type C4-dicarboxylate transport system permease large subunit